MPGKIIITKRTDDVRNDVYVELEGHKEVSATQKTLREALGDLLLLHSEAFGLDSEALKYNWNDPPTRRWLLEKGDPVFKNK